MKRAIRPITPSPPRRVRYPKFAFVWSAFAAGSVGAVARADCALPDHGATATKPEVSATTRGSGNGNAPVTAIAIVKKGPPPKVVEAKPEQRPIVMHHGGVRVQVRPPLPGAEPSVIPSSPAKPPTPKAAPQPNKEPTQAAPYDEEGDGRKSSLDGSSRPVVIHPHGPDEPCHHGGGPALVVRFT